MKALKKIIIVAGLSALGLGAAPAWALPSNGNFAEPAIISGTDADALPLEHVQYYPYGYGCVFPFPCYYGPRYYGPGYYYGGGYYGRGFGRGYGYRGGRGGGRGHR
jgi:hypothetical protein